MLVLVTGNAGCGKSTFVETLLAELPGFKLCCHDTIIRELYEEADVQADLQAALGCSTRQEVGARLDQDLSLGGALGRVFAPHLLERLAAAGVSSGSDLVLDIPMYFEQLVTHLPLGDDALKVCLCCDEELRRARLAARGVQPGRIDTLTKLQMGQEEKAARCDTVVNNNSDLSWLAAEARRIASTATACSEAAGLLQSCGRGFGLAAAMAAMEMPARHYHNSQHLLAMLRSLAVIQAESSAEIHDLFSLQLATLWHDHIYNTDQKESPRNEAASARAMLRRLAGLAPADSLGIAAAHINSTAGHIAASRWPFTVNPGLAADNALLLDLDLAILSADFDQLLLWEAGIRAEYGSYSGESYHTGRLEFLAGLASRRIYQSRFFAEREAIAHANIVKLQQYLVENHALD